MGYRPTLKEHGRPGEAALTIWLSLFLWAFMHSLIEYQ